MCEPVDNLYDENFERPDIWTEKAMLDTGIDESLERLDIWTGRDMLDTGSQPSGRLKSSQEFHIYRFHNEKCTIKDVYLVHIELQKFIYTQKL